MIFSISRLLALAAFITAPVLQAQEEVPFITSPDNVTLEMLRVAAVGPGVLVAIASFRAGATPTQPSIGRRRSSRPPMSLLSSRATFFALSRIQFARGA